MGQPSFQDLLAPFDPTAFPQITQAELLQLITGATPNTGFGLPFVTTDIGGVAQVPDANNTTKWQSYIWIRVGAASVLVYVWNPNAASDVTFQKWQSITLTSIPDGGVTNSKIAALAVTFDKIASCAWGSLTGIPTSFTPGGAAGGDLTGTYPNPTVGPNAITSSKLQSDATVDGNRAVGTNHLQNNCVDFATKLKAAGVAALSLLRMNAGATAWEAFTSLISQLANPIGGNATQGVRVKADASGFEYGPSIVQVVTAPATVVDSTNVVMTWATAPQITDGKQYLQATITPKKAGNLLRITFTCIMGQGANSYRGVLALFQDATVSAIAATTTNLFAAGDAIPLTLDVIVAAADTNAHTFHLRFGPSASGNAYINQTSAGAILGAAAIGNSTLTIMEIEPT